MVKGGSGCCYLAEGHPALLHALQSEESNGSHSGLATEHSIDVSQNVDGDGSSSSNTMELQMKLGGIDLVLNREDERRSLAKLQIADVTVSAAQHATMQLELQLGYLGVTSLSDEIEPSGQLLLHVMKEEKSSLLTMKYETCTGVKWDSALGVHMESVHATYVHCTVMELVSYMSGRGGLELLSVLQSSAAGQSTAGGVEAVSDGDDAFWPWHSLSCSHFCRPCS